MFLPRFVYRGKPIVNAFSEKYDFYRFQNGLLTGEKNVNDTVSYHNYFICIIFDRNQNPYFARMRKSRYFFCFFFTTTVARSFIFNSLLNLFSIICLFIFLLLLVKFSDVFPNRRSAAAKKHPSARVRIYVSPTGYRFLCHCFKRTVFFYK